eukprot:1146823-Pelagomonas_calceolata.AAC.2
MLHFPPNKSWVGLLQAVDTCHRLWTQLAVQVSNCAYACAQDLLSDLGHAHQQTHMTCEVYAAHLIASSGLHPHPTHYDILKEACCLLELGRDPDLACVCAEVENTGPYTLRPHKGWVVCLGDGLELARQIIGICLQDDVKRMGWRELGHMVEQHVRVKKVCCDSLVHYGKQGLQLQKDDLDVAALQVLRTPVVPEVAGALQGWVGGASRVGSVVQSYDDKSYEEAFLGGDAPRLQLHHLPVDAVRHCVYDSVVRDTRAGLQGHALSELAKLLCPCLVLLAVCDRRAEFRRPGPLPASCARPVPLLASCRCQGPLLAGCRCHDQLVASCGPHSRTACLKVKEEEQGKEEAAKGQGAFGGGWAGRTSSHDLHKAKTKQLMWK